MKELLLVDDDDANRLTLSTLLEDDGFAVDLAISFADAKQILERPARKYDAVLLDHALGDGYGADLVPLIRRALPGAKIVAMSASLNADAPHPEVDARLPKGLHFPDFLERLLALLG